MRIPTALFCLLSLVLTFISPPPLMAAGKVSTHENNALGGLHIGMKDSAVLKLLGKPESKDVSGIDHNWNFPAQGLKLTMSPVKKGSAQTVLIITASAPNKLTTKRGIRIGSTFAETVAAYKLGAITEDNLAVSDNWLQLAWVSFQFKDSKVIKVNIMEPGD